MQTSGEVWILPCVACHHTGPQTTWELSGQKEAKQRDRHGERTEEKIPHLHSHNSWLLRHRCSKRNKTEVQVWFKKMLWLCNQCFLNNNLANRQIWYHFLCFLWLLILTFFQGKWQNLSYNLWLFYFKLFTDLYHTVCAFRQHKTHMT